MEFTPIARNDFTAILKREGERNICKPSSIFIRTTDVLRPIEKDGLGGRG